jgi:hypothetical protein
MDRNTTPNPDDLLLLPEVAEITRAKDRRATVPASGSTSGAAT